MTDDENQSVAAHKIREQYRQMMEKISKDFGDNNFTGTSKYLHETITKTNDMFINAKSKNMGTRETNLDASVLATLSQFSRQKASTIQSDFFMFTPSEFIDKIKLFVNENSSEYLSPTGWETLGQLASNYTHYPSLANYMYGTFEKKIVEKKEKKIKEERKTQQFSQLKDEPEKIDDMQKGRGEEGTSEEVDRILQILIRVYEENDSQPLDLFKFVLNTTSFSLTVENMFHLSFLVRDNWVKLSKGDDNRLMIIPIYEGTQQQNNKKGKNQSETSHLVFNINYKVWRNLVEGYKNDAGLPMIDHDNTDDENAV